MADTLSLRRFTRLILALIGFGYVVVTRSTVQAEALFAPAPAPRPFRCPANAQARGSGACNPDYVGRTLARATAGSCARGSSTLTCTFTCECRWETVTATVCPRGTLAYHETHYGSCLSESELVPNRQATFEVDLVCNGTEEQALNECNIATLTLGGVYIRPEVINEACPIEACTRPPASEPFLCCPAPQRTDVAPGGELPAEITSPLFDPYLAD